MKTVLFVIYRKFNFFEKNNDGGWSKVFAVIYHETEVNP